MTDREFVREVFEHAAEQEPPYRSPADHIVRLGSRRRRRHRVVTGAAGVAATVAAAASGAVLIGAQDRAAGPDRLVAGAAAATPYVEPLETGAADIARQEALRLEVASALPGGRATLFREVGSVAMGTPRGISRNAAGEVVWRDGRGGTNFSFTSQTIASDLARGRCAPGGASSACVQVAVAGRQMSVYTPPASRNRSALSRVALLINPDGSALEVAQIDGRGEEDSNIWQDERGVLPLSDEQLAALVVALLPR